MGQKQQDLTDFPSLRTPFQYIYCVKYVKLLYVYNKKMNYIYVYVFSRRVYLKRLTKEEHVGINDQLKTKIVWLGIQHPTM